MVWWYDPYTRLYRGSRETWKLCSPWVHVFIDAYIYIYVQCTHVIRNAGSHVSWFYFYTYISCIYLIYLSIYLSIYIYIYIYHAHVSPMCLFPCVTSSPLDTSGIPSYFDVIPPPGYSHAVLPSCHEALCCHRRAWTAGHCRSGCVRIRSCFVNGEYNGIIIGYM